MHLTSFILLIFSTIFSLSFGAEKKWTHKTFSLKSPKTDGVEQQKQLLMDAQVRLLSKQEDSEIYRARPIEWPTNNKKDVRDDVVIKIVKLIGDGGAVRQAGQGNKPWKLITREVEIFQLARRNNSKFVLNLLESHFVNGAAYMVIELGQKDLNQGFWDLHRRWHAPGFEHRQMMRDIQDTIRQMAIAMDDMHRFAVHVAPKPENWLFVNGMLKLIDLQTSYATNADGVTIEEPREYFSVICEVLQGSKVHGAIRPIYASPEYDEMCAGFSAEGKQLKSVPRLTTMADIWSLGRLIAEMLGHTPSIRRRREQGWRWEDKHRILPRNLKESAKLPLHEILLIAFSHPHLSEKSASLKALTDDVLRVFRKEFPLITPLIEACFRQNLAERPSAAEILRFMDKFSEMEAHNYGYEEAKKLLAGMISFKENIQKEMLLSAPEIENGMNGDENVDEIIPEIELEIEEKELNCNGFPISAMEEYSYESMPEEGEREGKRVKLLKAPNLLGQGAFSSVFIGYNGDVHNFSPDNCVAIKFTRNIKVSENSFATIRAINKLDEAEHQNIIRVHDMGKTYDKKRLYVTVMELADGSLENWDEGNKLDSDESINGQILNFVEPLAELHKVAFHLDLKRANYVYARGIDGYGKVKLIDFDLSVRPNDPQSQKHGLLGDEAAFQPVGDTRLDYFAAPEYSEYPHAKVNSKTDMWTLGMMVIEMFLHRHKIVEEKRVELLKNIAQIFRGFKYVPNKEGKQYRYAGGELVQIPVKFDFDGKWLLQNLDELMYLLEALEQFPKAFLLANNILHEKQPNRLNADAAMKYLLGECKLIHSDGFLDRLPLFAENVTLGKLRQMTKNTLETIRINKNGNGEPQMMEMEREMTSQMGEVRAKRNASLNKVKRKIRPGAAVEWEKAQIKGLKKQKWEENTKMEEIQMEGIMGMEMLKLKGIMNILARIGQKDGKLAAELRRQNSLKNECLV